MKARDPLHIPWAFPLTEAGQLPLTGDAHPVRREGGRRLGWANASALALGVLLFGAWQVWTHRQAEPPKMREVRIVRYTELGVPPSIARPTVPQINIAQAVSRAVAPPRIAVPEPVADERAGQQTIATVEQAAEALAPITATGLGEGGGDSLVIDVDVKVEPQSPAPDEFVPVDEEPVRLRIADPVYPPTARAAGIEGTVMTRVLVGKDGRVKDVIVMEGPEMLKDAAVACAKTAVFRPAILQAEPVEVWVLMPVTFRLN